jgi:Na+-transporting NADH:ubiquinone oxidoreductase subunit NqrC
MGRKRVSKGQIIMKKDEKMLNVAKVMDINFTNNDFMEMFKYMYPNDWDNVKKRYVEHLKVNKGDKHFPMPEPMKYLSMVSTKYINYVKKEHEKEEILSVEQRNEIKERERSKSLLKIKKKQEKGASK